MAKDDDELQTIAAEYVSQSPTNQKTQELPEEALLQTDIGEQVAKILGTLEQATRKTWRESSDNEVLINRLEKLRQELIALAKIEKQSRQTTRKLLAKLIRNKKITAEEAKEIINLNVEDPDFNKKWHELTANLNDAANRDILTQIKREAYQAQKSNQEILKRIDDFREVLDEVGQALYQEVHRERAIKEYSKSLGFELKEGQTIRLKVDREVVNKQSRIVKEPMYQEATITKIGFDESNFVDLEGNKRSFPTVVPSITLHVKDEWADQSGYQLETDVTITADTFQRLVDMYDGQEIIEDNQDSDDITSELNQLQELLGEPIQQGQFFEYRDHSNRENVRVQIINIHKKEDGFLNTSTSQRRGQKVTVIELDKPVVVTTTPNFVKRSTLSLAEFAKWKRRADALKPMEGGIEELREALKKENERRNGPEGYNRDPKHYPPIKLEPEEVLYYETNPPATFVIQDIYEEEDPPTEPGGKPTKTVKIKLDNGSVYTGTTFLSWVRQHEVEAKTAEAEAAKATSYMKNGDPEKKKTEDKIKEAVEKAMQDRIQKADHIHSDDDVAPAPPSASYLRQLWNQTHFLSLGDMYFIGQEIMEFIKRKMDLNRKNRTGAVGNAALSPIYTQLGGEFKALQQNAENEEVQRFNQAYEQYGYGELYELLKTTNNRYQLKAILTTLSNKGWIRWDDPNLWNAINRISRTINTDLYIGEYDETKIAKAIDGIWGDSAYIDFRAKNESSYLNKRNSERDSAKRLETDLRGGVKGRLQEMLARHMRGEFIDSAQYEGYIYYAMQNGKLTFADKIYFLFMGLGAQSPSGSPYAGRTILDLSRMGDCGTDLLGNFPIIEYFSLDVPLMDRYGNFITDKEGNTTGKLDPNYIQGVIHKYIEQDAKKSVSQMQNASEFEPGESLQRFVERDMLQHPRIKQRIEKVRDTSQWDHDDLHIFGSQLSYREIEGLTLKARSAASTPGLRNTLVGLNHFTSLYLDEYTQATASGDEQKAQEHLHSAIGTLLSFIRLNSILENRYYHNNPDQSKLSPDDLMAYSGVDEGRMVIEHVSELNEFMTKLIQEMQKESPGSFSNLEQTWNFISRTVPPNQHRQQQAQANDFPQILLGAMSSLEEKKGKAGVARVISRVQGHGPNQLVKGIQQRAKDKKEIAELEQRARGFEAPQAASLTADVETLEQLRRQAQKNQALSPEAKRAQQDANLNRIIGLVKQREFGAITSADQRVLAQAINNLKQQGGYIEEDGGEASYYTAA